MPRKRMMDPSLWEDEHFGKLTDKAKILFVACISNADDDGRLSANCSHLRAVAFRFNDIRLSEIQKIRDEVESVMGNFIVYSVKGCEYIQLQKWEEYQTQRDDRRKPSKYPDVSQMTDKCQTDVCLSKVKLSKDKLVRHKDRFMPPTQDEVKNYCKERGNKVDAEKFVNFYESKGWMVGKNKMKSWQAAVRNWEKSTDACGKPVDNLNKRGQQMYQEPDWMKNES